MRTWWSQSSSGLYSWSATFLTYINDFPDNLTSNLKLFAVNTFLFSVFKDIVSSSINLNSDLHISISGWTFQGKMNFDPDPKKQAKKIIFSQSLKNRVILAYFLTKKTQKNLQKCLGIILDTQLNFKEHLPNNSNELNKTIGLLRKLQTMLPRFLCS